MDNYKINPENFHIIDQIMDDFQRILKDMKIKYDLVHAVIERWRWDLPQIGLIWKGQDAIWRNINILVDTPMEKEAYSIGHVEINAWLDLQKDNRWIRRWRHQSIGETGTSDPSVLWYSYSVLTSWTLDELTSIHLLSDAASHLLDQQRG